MDVEEGGPTPAHSIRKSYQRRDCPISVQWAHVQSQNDRRWMDVVNCPRFTLAVNPHDCHCIVVREVDEITVHSWCLEMGSGRWMSYPTYSGDIGFAFESDKDAVVFMTTHNEIITGKLPPRPRP